MNRVSSAVGFAAKLKPEIRLAQAISEFNASLNNQNQRTKFRNLQSQSPPDPDDIIRLTEEINRDGARTHRSWRPYGTRLVAMLERMRQFAPIGDVLVGGSQNLIACGVWAVVRLSLETSLSFLSYFENVTSMMLRLGRSLSLHKDFAMLFPSCSKLQSYMCEYTIVMVNICAKIMHGCDKSTLSHLAASLASTFDTTFRPLESDLAMWAQLIEKHAAVLLAKASLQSQSSVLERFNRLQVTMARESANREEKTRKHTLFTALCPDQGEFNLIWRRERKRGTSSWMYEQDAYKNWLSSKAMSVLWLKGNLGSGKTVAMASAAAQLISAAPSMEPKGAVTVSYFFCQSNNPKTLCAATLLGSFVGQALRSSALESSFMSFLEQREITPDSCARLEDYIDILLDATPSTWRGIFVLDGLDEMPQEEVDDVFGQLKRLKGHRRVHLLCSSRPTSACYSIAESSLNVTWALSMETVDRSDEIRAYISTEISRWDTIRPLAEDLKRLVEEQLLAGCQGMFLWLSLQLDDICPRYTQELRSDAEILDILGNLPKDLPEAFDKALSRMRDDKYGSKLFKLVASAETPLDMDELRVAVNVEPGNTNWDNSTLFGSGKALISAYGGSLLDIDEEDLHVRFIHYSALLHLTAPSTEARTSAFHFDLSDAEQTLGAVCITYLNYSVFENRISTAQKVSFGQVPQTTAGSVMPSGVSQTVFSLLSKHGRWRDAKVDLERLSYELQNQKWRVCDDVHLFLDYAQDQWLSSTRNIWSSDSHELLSLWKKALTNSIVSASLPWDSVSEAAAWALFNGHATLFQHYLHSDDQGHLMGALNAAVDAVMMRTSKIRLRGEGLGWLAPLYLVQPTFKPSTLRRFIGLGCKPFNPTLTRSPSPNLIASDLTTSVELHMETALRSYPKDEKPGRFLLFLANYDDQLTMLHLAIRHGCRPVAFELLRKGEDPNGGYAKGRPSPLQISIRTGDTDLAQRLVELGADIGANPDNGSPPLFLAIDDLRQRPHTSPAGPSEPGPFYPHFMPQHMEFFSFLLDRGENAINRRYGPKRENACHYICRMTFEGDLISPEWEVEAVGLLEALIEHGADINLRNGSGETPLMLVVRAEKWELTRLLLEHRADPNIRNHIGARPLHYAWEVPMIRHLLHQRANPNVATVDGHITPLMMTVHRGQADAVSALLDGGADPELALGPNLTREEVLLLGWPGEPAAKPQSNMTAFQLCLWRLEGGLDALNQSRPGRWDTTTFNRCRGLVSILAEFLDREIVSKDRYLRVLFELRHSLSLQSLKIWRELPDAQLTRALKLVKATRATS